MPDSAQTGMSIAATQSLLQASGGGGMSGGGGPTIMPQWRPVVVLPNLDVQMAILPLQRQGLFDTKICGLLSGGQPAKAGLLGLNCDGLKALLNSGTPPGGAEIQVADVDQSMNFTPSPTSGMGGGNRQIG